MPDYPPEYQESKEEPPTLTQLIKDSYRAAINRKHDFVDNTDDVPPPPSASATDEYKPDTDAGVPEYEKKISQALQHHVHHHQTDRLDIDYKAHSHQQHQEEEERDEVEYVPGFFDEDKSRFTDLLID